MRSQIFRKKDKDEIKEREATTNIEKSGILGYVSG